MREPALAHFRKGASEPSEGQKFGRKWDMTQPLTRADLEGFSLDDLRDINAELIDRATKVIAEIADLSGKYDDSEYLHYQNVKMRRFNVQIMDGDKPRLIYHGGHKAFADLDLFVPGAWWQEKLDRLDELRQKKAAHAAAFAPAEAERLISRLVEVQ